MKNIFKILSVSFYLIVICGFVVSGQVNHSNILKNEVSFGIIKPFYGRININYAHYFQNQSLYFGISYMDRNDFEDQYGDIDNITGLSFDLAYRFHLKNSAKSASKAFYIGPLFKYQIIDKLFYNSTNVLSLREFDLTSIGWVLGLKIDFMQNMFIDAYVGPALRFSSFKGPKLVNDYHKINSLEYQGSIAIANLSIGFKF